MKFKWNYSKVGIDDAFILRKKVFVFEQGFSEDLEFDDIDSIAHHVVMYSDNNLPIGVARLFGEGDEYHIGRVCVDSDYRGKGLGGLLMKTIETKALLLGVKTLCLSAQVESKGFYQSLGYIPIGDIYLDEHCPHIKMVKTLIWYYKKYLLFYSSCDILLWYTNSTCELVQCFMSKVDIILCLTRSGLCVVWL